jgi:hypothetical protein
VEKEGKSTVSEFCNLFVFENDSPSFLLMIEIPRCAGDEKDFQSLHNGVIYGAYGSQCYKKLFKDAKENEEIAIAINEILDAFPDSMNKELLQILQDDNHYCMYNKEYLTITTLENLRLTGNM